MGSNSSLLGGSGACSPWKFLKAEHRKAHFPGIFFGMCASGEKKLSFPVLPSHKRSYLEIQYSGEQVLWVKFFYVFSEKVREQIFIYMRSFSQTTSFLLSHVCLELPTEEGKKNLFFLHTCRAYLELCRTFLTTTTPTQPYSARKLQSKVYKIYNKI